MPFEKVGGFCFFFAFLRCAWFFVFFFFSILFVCFTFLFQFLVVLGMRAGRCQAICATGHISQFMF